jgi:hypothetical protein
MGCSVEEEGGLLNGSDSDGQEVGDVLAEGVEVLGIVVGLDGGDVGLDLLVVEGEVLGNLGDELLFGGEDLGPFLDSSKILADSLAGVELGGELTDNLLQGQDGTCLVDITALLEVGDRNLDLSLKGLFSSDARFNIDEVLRLDKLGQEAGDELGDIGGGHAGGEQLGQEVGSGFTGLEVLSGGPVSGDGLHVLVDHGEIEEGVLSGALEELDGGLEDLGPLLNFLPVVIHTFAGGQSRGEHTSESTEVLQRVDDVLLREVADNKLALGLDVLSALEALLEFVEVVIAGKAINDTSNEVRDGGDAEGDGFESLHMIILIIDIDVLFRTICG